jgi:hypothetical protein
MRPKHVGAIVQHFNIRFLCFKMYIVCIIWNNKEVIHRLFIGFVRRGAPSILALGAKCRAT